MNWLFFFFQECYLHLCLLFSASSSLFHGLHLSGSWFWKLPNHSLAFATIYKRKAVLIASLLFMSGTSLSILFFCILLSLSFIISPLTPRVLWGLTEEPFLNQRWINNIRILYDCLGMSVMCSEQRKIQGSSCLIKSSSIKIGKPNICSTNRLYLLPLACAIQ